ncbi:hypothetical protein Baya_4246 [Bagarius yarrelli]|uniref:Uncharacterized protein n=1 Tax=Bagarius yarrelli TaxID=175774 RepID=A0A556TVW9_BAGYA|nr:hypothetical protein Baya_4246 [Bagarius yarrelli]
MILSSSSKSQHENVAKYHKYTLRMREIVSDDHKYNNGLFKNITRNKKEPLRYSLRTKTVNTPQHHSQSVSLLSGKRRQQFGFALMTRSIKIHITVIGRSAENAKRLTVTVGDKGTLGLQMFGLMTDGCGTGTGSSGMASVPAWCHLHPSASPYLHNTLHNGADRVGYSGHGGCARMGNDSALSHL